MPWLNWPVIRLFSRSDREQLTALVNAHVAAVIPGVTVSVNGLLNQQLNLIPRQSTLSVGARWDFAKNAAFKVQYDHVNLDAGSTGTFGNFQPGFQPGGRAGIFSVVVDFVF